MLKHELTYEIMRPESVGAPGTRLVLGKHSGMRGLDARCRALGHRLRQPELERLYVKVTALADRTKTVDDEQLTAIIREELAAATGASAPGLAESRRRGMSLKIALLPGDGIGPEVTEEAVRILKNVAEHSGKPFSFSTHPIGGVAIDARRRRPARADARSVPRRRCGVTRRRRPSEVRRPAAVGTSRSGAAGVAPGARRIRQPAPSDLLRAARQAHGVSAGARQRREPADHPRAAGRPVLRRAARLRSLGQHRVQHVDLFAARDRARGAASRSTRARERRKKVASIDKANVLETSRLWRAVVSEMAKELSRRRARARLRRHGGDAARDLADQLRRDALRQPVRRHPQRSGGVDCRLAGRAAVGHARRPRRSVRAGPRLGARHRRQGLGQSDRRDRERRDAAALQREHGQGSRGNRSRHRGRAGGTAPAPRISPRPASARSRRAKWARRSKTRSTKFETGGIPTMRSDHSAPHSAPAPCSTRCGTRTSCASWKTAAPCSISIAISFTR